MPVLHAFDWSLIPVYIIDFPQSQNRLHEVLGSSSASRDAFFALLSFSLAVRSSNKASLY